MHQTIAGDLGEQGRRSDRVTLRVTLDQRLMFLVEFPQPEPIDDDDVGGAAIEPGAAAQQRPPHRECRGAANVVARDLAHTRRTQAEREGLATNLAGECRTPGVIGDPLGITNPGDPRVIEWKADGRGHHRTGKWAPANFVNPDEKVPAGPGKAFVGQEWHGAR